MSTQPPDQTPPRDPISIARWNRTRVEVARGLFRHSARTRYAPMLVMVAILGLFLNRLGTTPAAALMTAYVLVQAMFDFTRYRFNRDPTLDGKRAETYLRLYALLSLGSGGCWGMLTFLTLPLASADERMLVLLTAAVMGIGAVMTRSYHPPSTATFGTAIALPVMAYLVTQHGTIGLVSTVITLLFVLSLIQWSLLVYNTYRAEIQLRLENEDLIERLKKAVRDADGANRSRTEFLANISHELRTPMNGVVGALELLDRTALSADAARLARIAHESASTLLEVIDDVLDMAKIESGRLAFEAVPFAPADAIRAAAGGFALAAERKGVELHLSLDAGLPKTVAGDPLRFRQIISNLLSNAVKFTSRGRIALIARAAPHEIGWRIEVQIADTGIGIAPEAMKRLFQPFEQADASTTRRYGGSGLGLAICRQLVERMGGKISAQPRPGGGTVFAFEVLFASTDKLVEAVEGGLPTGQVGRTVLVVDDSAINREIAARQLERLGYAIETCANGEDALERIRGKRPALLLLDLQMPGKDGYQVARELRAAESAAGMARLPIVALTGNVLSGERERCLAAGMDDYLAKPVRLEHLGLSVARWIGRAIEPVRSEAPGAPGPQAGDADFDLEALLQTTGVGLDDLRPLMRLFLDQAPICLVEIAQAAAKNRGDDAARAAHTLKGESGYLGAETVHRLAREAERLAKSGDCAAISRLLPEIEAALARTRAKMAAA
ncbi:MAG: response regulator [Alphaproteobacteria bacterium]|nr:response regulator [Alphaproteobacteria bacterium]